MNEIIGDRKASLAQAAVTAEQLATRFALPFRGRSWQGSDGAFGGRGAGQSPEFMDLRQYHEGDDLRHLDWRAWSRSGRLMVKQFREEVSPRVDLYFDGSFSVCGCDEKKAQAAWTLLLLTVHSAADLGADLRCWYWNGEGDAQLLSQQQLLAQDLPSLPQQVTEQGVPPLQQVAWRPDSLRLFISDLLWPGGADLFDGEFFRAAGRCLFWVPFSPEEANPSWRENVELIDCEQGDQHKYFIGDKELQNYRTAYARHFEQWQDLARRHGAAILRLDSAGDLSAQLATEGLRSQAVEVTK